MMVGRLLFYASIQEFFSYEGGSPLLQDLLLEAFEQRGVFILPRLLCHKTVAFAVSSKEPPHLVMKMNLLRQARGTEDLFYPRYKKMDHTMLTNITAVQIHPDCDPPNSSEQVKEKSNASLK
jgi:hypothetical protein